MVGEWERTREEAQRCPGLSRLWAWLVRRVVPHPRAPRFPAGDREVSPDSPVRMQRLGARAVAVARTPAQAQVPTRACCRTARGKAITQDAALPSTRLEHPYGNIPCVPASPGRAVQALSEITHALGESVRGQGIGERILGCGQPAPQVSQLLDHLAAVPRPVCHQRSSQAAQHAQPFSGPSGTSYAR